MKLADARHWGETNTDEPLPIHAGRCEAPSGTVLCGQPARWLWCGQFRCNAHKPEAKS